ncbi:MAG: UDP-3-O-(3-hydroxymyristoyl)glucosamine N-acyltransferase [Magnetococcales bacterium]|nr:UDP-3-O-(3-hydroxymyristoyl)glucosamine N-acyltransferase [Magnetococcales bacterium]NGZ06066.1 UDP-3-O-(3-hydroxymyristoyl)glucosamine N-acyltransferase [Magnetococcales bacterium]
MQLTELARQLALEHRGGDVEIRGVAPVEQAATGDLTFVTARKWLQAAHGAAALLVSSDLLSEAGAELAGRPLLISRTPALDAGRAGLLLGARELRVHGIHASAVIDPTARLAEGVQVGPRVVIGAGVVIGADSVIHAGAVIHDDTVIGARCVIHANAVIGGEGFGFEYVDGAHRKIPHLGIVQIEDDVEVGACTTIDRARFGATRIGAGTKIDNLVQIAHNVQIGRACVIVSQVGIAGSCRIEDGVVLAGQAGLVPHVTVGRGARVAAATGVAVDVPAGVTWSGWWGGPHRENLAQINALRKLPEFMKAMRAIMRGAEPSGG